MLIVPSYPDPTATEPAAGALAWIGGLTLDFESTTGQIHVIVHRDGPAAEAAKAPLDRFGIALGEDYGPGSGGAPTFAELLSDPEFAAAFAVIRLKLFTEVLAAHPRLPGATLAE